MPDPIILGGVGEQSNHPFIDLVAETWRAETVLSTLTRMWSSQISEWLAQLLRVSTTDSAEKVHCMMAMSLNAQIQSFIWRHAARQMDVPGKPRRRNIYAHVWYLELRSSPLWNNNIRIFPIPGLTLTFERNMKAHDQFYIWHQTTLTNKIIHVRIMYIFPGLVQQPSAPTH